jgi:hypothetical protein
MSIVVFRAKDGSDTLPRNVGGHLQDDTESQPRRPQTKTKFYYLTEFTNCHPSEIRLKHIHCCLYRYQRYHFYRIWKKLANSRYSSSSVEDTRSQDNKTRRAFLSGAADQCDLDLVWFVLAPNRRQKRCDLSGIRFVLVRGYHRKCEFHLYSSIADMPFDAIKLCTISERFPCLYIDMPFYAIKLCIISERFPCLYTDMPFDAIKLCTISERFPCLYTDMPFDAIKLCTIIERFPCLYNHNLPEYSIKNVTDKASKEN